MGGCPSLVLPEYPVFLSVLITLLREALFVRLPPNTTKAGAGSLYISISVPGTVLSVQ